SDVARERFGTVLLWLNQGVLAVFVAELVIKLVAFGPRFFRSGWNVFDFLIVGIALVPASGPLQILRSLRILRVLRLLSTVQRLRMLVDSLLQALPGIGWTAALLLMMFYVFGVMGTELFGEQFPDWFGSLGKSAYTLFQIMTLESWSMGIARPVMETFPYAWAFFVPFILIATFTMLNLFIAVIVNAIQAEHDAEHAVEVKQIESVVSAHADERADAIQEELRALRAEVARLAGLLDRSVKG